LQVNGNLKISDFAFACACVVIFSNIGSIVFFKVSVGVWDQSIVARAIFCRPVPNPNRPIHIVC
jgi:hypothetical protein